MFLYPTLVIMAFIYKCFYVYRLPVKWPTYVALFIDTSLLELIQNMEQIQNLNTDSEAKFNGSPQ